MKDRIEISQPEPSANLVETDTPPAPGRSRSHIVTDDPLFLRSDEIEREASVRAANAEARRIEGRSIIHLLKECIPDYGKEGDLRRMGNKTLCLHLRSGIRVLQRVPWRTCCDPSVFLTTSQVFDVSWPLFVSKVRLSESEADRLLSAHFEWNKSGAREGDKLSKQKLVDGFLLVAWFVATTLRMHLARSEENDEVSCVLNSRGRSRTFHAASRSPTICW